MLSDSSLTLLSLSLALASEDMILSDTQKQQLINIANKVELCPEMRPDEWTDIKEKSIEPLLNSHEKLRENLAKYQKFLSNLLETDILPLLPSRSELNQTFASLDISTLEYPPPRRVSGTPSKEIGNRTYVAFQATCKEPEKARTLWQKFISKLLEQ